MEESLPANAERQPVPNAEGGWRRRSLDSLRPWMTAAFTTKVVSIPASRNAPDRRIGGEDGATRRGTFRGRNEEMVLPRSHARTHPVSSDMRCRCARTVSGSPHDSAQGGAPLSGKRAHWHLREVDRARPSQRAAPNATSHRGRNRCDGAVCEVGLSCNGCANACSWLPFNKGRSR